MQIPVASDVVLAGLLGRPRSVVSNDIGRVILVHGFAAEKTENGLFSDVATDLMRKGYFVLAYDWRGLGESTGSFVTANLEQHVEDFQRVAEWFCHCTGVSVSKTCAIGFSLGAIVVAMSMKRGLRFADNSYWSPALRPAVSMWPRYDTNALRRQLAANGFISKPETQVQIGEAILDSLHGTDLGRSALEFDIPILICHGTGDDRIPIGDTREAFDAAPRSNVRFAEFSGASHSFRPETQHWSKLKQLLLLWLENLNSEVKTHQWSGVHLREHEVVRPMPLKKRPRLSSEDSRAALQS